MRKQKTLFISDVLPKLALQISVVSRRYRFHLLELMSWSAPMYQVVSLVSIGKYKNQLKRASRNNTKPTGKGLVIDSIDDRKNEGGR
jgi:hypothetical protein